MGGSETLTEMRTAHALGMEAGRKHGSTGNECPFDHDKFHQRIAWFDGFSEGRDFLARGERAVAALKRSMPFPIR